MFDVNISRFIGPGTAMVTFGKQVPPDIRHPSCKCGMPQSPAGKFLVIVLIGPSVQVSQAKTVLFEGRFLRMVFQGFQVAVIQGAVGGIADIVAAQPAAR